MYKKSILFFILIGFILFLYLSSPNLLAFLVKETFANGTGCLVRVEDPKADFLNLKFSLKNVDIRCLEEEASNGHFSFNKIEVKVDLSGILNKKIVLNEVNIYDASVRSFSSESSFLKTLKFILSKDESKKELIHVWVPKIIIWGSKSVPSNFIFGTNVANISGSIDHFSADDPIDSPTSITKLSSKINNLNFNFPYGTENLGNAIFDADVKEGVIYFNKCSSVFNDETLDFSGKIISKSEELFLNFNANKKVHFLNDKLNKSKNKDFNDTVLNFIGSVNGTIDDPRIVIKSEDSIGDIEYSSKQKKIFINKLNLFIKKLIGFDLFANNLSNQIISNLSEIKIEAEGFISTEDMSNSKININSNFLLQTQESHSDELKLNLSNDNDKQNLKLVSKSQNKPILDFVFNIKDINPKLIGVVSLTDFPLGNYIERKILKNQNDISLSLEGNFNAPINNLELINATLKLDVYDKKLNQNLIKSNYSIADKLSYLNGTILDKNNTFKIENRDFNLLNVDIELKSFPINIFEIPSNLNNLDAKVDAQLKLSTSLEEINKNSANILISAIQISKENKNLRFDLPIRAEIRDSNLDLTPVNIYFSDQLFTISGNYKLSQGINLKAKGKFLPGEFINLGREVEDIEGSLLVDASMSGDIVNPSILGSINLDDISFSSQLGNTILGADHINGTVLFNGKDIIFNNVRGEISDGNIELKGIISNIFDERYTEGGIFLDAKDVKLEPDNGMYLDLSANLKLDIIKNLEPVLSGQIRIDEGSYTNEINLESLLKVITKFILNGFGLKKQDKIEFKESGISTNIHISSPSSILIDTNVLQAEINSDIWIKSDLFNPKLEGSVDVVDGSYQINQTKFQIVGGKISLNDYIGELNPDISVTSEGSLRSQNSNFTQVYMAITGKLKDYKISLTSDGVSSPQDLARQIGVGTGGSQFLLVQGEKKNVGFRELISPSSNLSLSQRFAGITGFDDVRVENAVSARTGEFVPQVIAGRQLIPSYRLNISSELAGDRASGSRLEYKLDDSYSLFSSWRSQAVTDANRTGGGNFGLGIRFNKSFKGFSLGSIFSDSTRERQEVVE